MSMQLFPLGVCKSDSLLLVHPYMQFLHGSFLKFLYLECLSWLELFMFPSNVRKIHLFASSNPSVAHLLSFSKCCVFSITPQEIVTSIALLLVILKSYLMLNSQVHRFKSNNEPLFLWLLFHGVQGHVRVATGPA